MMPQPPPGQGPIDPRGAFAPPQQQQGQQQPPPPQSQQPYPPRGGGGPGGGPPGSAPPGWGFGPPMPPPMMMPPPGYYPPPPRQTWARTIFFTLASSIFGLSIALNLYLLIAVGLTGSDAGAQHNVLIEGDPS